jgi:hypothetical protein
MIGTNLATAEVVDNTEPENGRTELNSWEAAQVYHQAGYEPIPLKPGTKQPAVKDWQTATFKDLAMLWCQRSLFGDPQPGVGLRLPDLVVVDVEGPATPHASDPTSFVGTTPVVARTPSGGRYFFYRRDNEIRSKIKAPPGIEVLTTRCFVAVSPTPGYEWEDGALEALLKGTLPGFSVVRRLVERKPARIQTSARVAPQRAKRIQVFVAAHETTVSDVLTAGLRAIVEK